MVLQFGRLILEDYYRNYNFPLDITFRGANSVSELSNMSRLDCSHIYPNYNRDVSIDIMNFVHYSRVNINNSNVYKLYIHFSRIKSTAYPRFFFGWNIYHHIYKKNRDKKNGK